MTEMGKQKHYIIEVCESVLHIHHKIHVIHYFTEVLYFLHTATYFFDTVSTLIGARVLQLGSVKVYTLNQDSILSLSLKMFSLCASF